MKHSIFMNLILLVAILFFGCTEDNLLVSEFDQSSDATISLKKGNYDDKLFKDGDNFEGVTRWYGDESDHSPDFFKQLANGRILTKDEQTTWYDNASDERVKGISTWYVNKTTKKDVTKFWGKAELLVDNGKGKWEMTWHGYITEVFDENGTLIGNDLDCIAFGTGVDGEVKGLVAKWHYLMEGRFYDSSSWVYNFKGTIK